MLRLIGGLVFAGGMFVLFLSLGMVFNGSRAKDAATLSFVGLAGALPIAIFLSLSGLAILAVGWDDEPPGSGRGAPEGGETAKSEVVMDLRWPERAETREQVASRIADAFSGLADVSPVLAHWYRKGSDTEPLFNGKPNAARVLELAGTGAEVEGWLGKLSTAAAEVSFRFDVEGSARGGNSFRIAFPKGVMGLDEQILQALRRTLDPGTVCKRNRRNAGQPEG